MTDTYFQQATLDFLHSLASNNNRDWFEHNKQRYEIQVRTPALDFISDISGELATLSPHFLAIPKKVGGSLMRVYRDTRFSKDKRPYKTNIGIQFRHEMGKDVHAPGYYVHIQPGECFLGAGIWRPDANALANIRQRIDEKGKEWLAAKDNADFQKFFTLGGESLQRPPRGYAKDHPLIDDLRRKDFIAISTIDDSLVTSKEFHHHVMDQFATATPYMRFLCKALNLRFD